METKTSTFLKSAVNSGLIFGVIMIIISLASWMLNFMPVGIGKSLLYLLFSIVLYTVILFYFTKSYRDGMLGGYINYGHAFLYGLTVFMIASLLSVIYNFIFNKFIDPEYAGRVVKASVNATEEYMRSKGVPDAQISDMVDKMMERAKPSAIKTAITGLIGGAVVGAIVSLISSAFAKKAKDPFVES